MALFNATFYDSIESLDTSISMLVTIGTHDTEGWPNPLYTFAFGTTPYGIYNIPYSRPMNIYPYLKDNLSVGQSLNIEERRHVISNTSIKLVNQEVLSPNNQSENYSLLSDIFSYRFPNPDNNFNRSIMNEHCAIWIYTSQTKDTNGLMPIFRGAISDISLTKDTLTLKAEDHIAKIVNRQLPIAKMPHELTGTLSDGFEYGMDEDQSNRPVPIVLGHVRHAHPVQYRDQTSSLSVSNDEAIGSMGYQKQYLACDRVGKMWPNSNISLLPHGSHETSFLDYLWGAPCTINGNTSNSPELTYQQTPLSIFAAGEWEEVVDIKDGWLGGLYMSEFSFQGLESGEILCNSSWTHEDTDDSDTEFFEHLPTSPFANDQVMFLLRSEFSQGNWSTGQRIEVEDLSFAMFLDFVEGDWQLSNAFSTLAWGGLFDENGLILSTNGAWMSPDNAEHLAGEFNPNQGLWTGFNVGVETTILGISGDQAYDFWSSFGGDNHCKLSNGFVGAQLDQDKLNSINFQDWILIYYYDVGFKTPTVEQYEDDFLAEICIDLDGNTNAGNQNTMFMVDFTSKFLHTNDILRVKNVVGEALQTGGVVSNEQFIGLNCETDFIEDLGSIYDDGWLIANPNMTNAQGQNHEATDWVRVKQRIVRGDSTQEGWEYGLPAGMGFRLWGASIKKWDGSGGNYYNDFDTHDFSGGAVMQINDIQVAYLLGQTGAYKELRVISAGRNSGTTYVGGQSLTDPNESIVVLLEGVDEQIDNPVSMIVHLLEKEIGIDFNGVLTDNIIEAFNSHSENAEFGLGTTTGAWKLNLNLVETKTAKEVFEEIAKSALLVPMIKTDINGAFKLNFWFLKQSFENIVHPDIPVFGCNLNYDGVANYNPHATINDGSCLDDDGNEVILGCNSDALGQFPDIFGDCRPGYGAPYNNHNEDGVVINNDLQWAHGMCFDEPQSDYTHNGFTGWMATNFNPNSNVYDYTCQFSELGGCMDPNATNYDTNAEWNDGTCSYEDTHTDALRGVFYKAMIYYTDIDDDISASEELGDGNYVLDSTAGHQYNWAAVDYIKHDMYKIFYRSFLHYAYQMMEWAWYHRGDFGMMQEDEYSHGGSVEYLFAIQGYNWEIYIRDPKYIVTNPAQHKYWTIMKLWGFFPKNRDYVGMDQNIISAATYESQVWYPSSYPGLPACPGWSNDGTWFGLVSFLCNVDEDTDIGVPAGDHFGWPIEYDRPRIYQELEHDLAGAGNIDVYDAWRYYKDEGYDWDAALYFAELNDTPSRKYLTWLRMFTEEAVNEIHYIEDPANAEDVEVSFFVNLCYSNGVHGGLLTWDQASGYNCEWLKSTQEWYWVNEGNEINCQFDGLGNMDQWAWSEEWESSHSHEDNLLEWIIESKVVGREGGSSTRIRKRTYILFDVKEGLKEIWGWGDSEAEENLHKLAGICASRGGSHYGQLGYESYNLYEYDYRDGDSLLGNTDGIPILYPGMDNPWKSLLYVDMPAPPPYGNWDLDLQSYSTSRTMHSRKSRDGTTTSSRDWSITSDIDRLIKANEVLEYKIYKSDLKKLASRVKVEYDYDDGSSTFYKSTDWEYWYELPAIIENYQTIYGLIPTGQELLDYYGLDKTGYDEDGVPNEFFASQKVISLHNTSNDATAEKVRRAHLGMYMNQHTKMDLTLPLKYCNIELGDYVALDYLIQGQKAYGEDYSLDYYVQTKGEDTPTGVHHIRNGQVIYPLFLVEDVRYTMDNVKIKITQVHDWTGQQNTGIPPEFVSPSGGADIENGFQGNWVDHEPQLITIGSTQHFVDEFHIGVENKTPFKIAPSISLSEWTLHIKNVYTEHLTTIEVEPNMGTTSYFTNSQGDVITFDNLLSGSSGYFYTFDEAGLYEVWIQYTQAEVDYITSVQQVGIRRLGDGNGDANVDVLDIVQMVQRVLSGWAPYIQASNYTSDFIWGDVNPAASIFPECLDVNNSGLVNVQDIVIVVGEVLGN